MTCLNPGSEGESSPNNDQVSRLGMSWYHPQNPGRSGVSVCSEMRGYKEGCFLLSLRSGQISRGTFLVASGAVCKKVSLSLRIHIGDLPLSFTVGCPLPSEARFKFDRESSRTSNVEAETV